MCFSSNQFMSTVHPSIHPSISPSFIFIHSFFRSFVRSFMIGPSIHPPIHTLIHSFIYFIYSFVRAIIHHQFCLDFLMIPCPPPPSPPTNGKLPLHPPVKEQCFVRGRIASSNKDTTYLLGRGRFRSPALSDSQVCMATGVDQ